MRELGREGNTVVKGENTAFQHFHLFQQYFPKHTSPDIALSRSKNDY